MREKRTRLDFKDHELIVKKSEDLSSYYLKKPNTVQDSILFINTNGIMAVTGDYGNWIFCREFIPTPDGYVSDGYWEEKLSIASTQKYEDYDYCATRKEIEKRLADKDDPPDKEEKEYYENMLDCVDDEFEYTYRAYNDRPRSMDAESIPFVRITKYWLLVIFDAFDEICNRMKFTEIDCKEVVK